MKTNWELILDDAEQSTNAEVITAGLYEPGDGAGTNTSPEGVPEPSYIQEGDDFECVLFPRISNPNAEAGQNSWSFTHECIIPPGIDPGADSELRAEDGRVFDIQTVKVYGDSAPGHLTMEAE